MFTGLVASVGKVTSIGSSGSGIRLRVDIGELAWRITNGASVAVDGACLTATEISGAQAAFDVGEETARVTTIGGFRPEQRVNLELALTPQSALGGHFVQGHVDGLGRIESVSARPGGWQIKFSAPATLLKMMAPKGSVAVDGISLTLVDVEAAGFSIFVIPHTYSATTLAGKRAGDAVNLETDMIAKYVFRYLAQAQGQASPSGITEELLKEQGFG
jgi:riboflavin synthase